MRLHTANEPHTYVHGLEVYEVFFSDSRPAFIFKMKALCSCETSGTYS